MSSSSSHNHVHAFTVLKPNLRTQIHKANPRSFAQYGMASKDVSDAPSDGMMMDITTASRERSTDPKPILLDFFQKSLGDDTHGSSIKPTMSFMVAALALALVLSPLPSDAAMSGGRIGGSYSPSSQSRSMPSRGGGASRGGYSSGYSGGYYSRPSVVIAPSIGYGYSPFISPFSSGYYGGGYGGGAVIAASGPSIFDVLFVGGLLFAVTNILQRGSSDQSIGTSFDGFGSSTSSALGYGTSVIQLSVALEVPNRDDPTSILNMLERLSKTAKTDSRVGIQNLTSQVALELLRRRSSIVSASSQYKHFRDPNQAKRHYEQRAIVERSKFEKESISTYGGVNYAIANKNGNDNPTSLASLDGKATMAVVTIVMAIDGDTTKVPTAITSISDVEEALRRISSDSKVDDCLQSVEILWTPADRSESLSRRDVLADYPELRSV